MRPLLNLSSIRSFLCSSNDGLTSLQFFDENTAALYLSKSLSLSTASGHNATSRRISNCGLVFKESCNQTCKGIATPALDPLSIIGCSQQADKFTKRKRGHRTALRRQKRSKNLLFPAKRHWQVCNREYIYAYAQKHSSR